MFTIPLIASIIFCHTEVACAIDELPQQKAATHELVNIRNIDSRIQLDLRYATENNFCKVVLYPVAECYIHRDVAHALKRVQDRLIIHGLYLKIFDGYRPLSVQWHMWNLIQDERYVSNPAKNKGRHTRGTAVDLTLVDEHGNEIPMPTEFDNMTERAHADYACVAENVQKNRALLQEVMVAEGFEIYPFEWWHFDYKGWKDDIRYPSLDISLLELVNEEHS